MCKKCKIGKMTKLSFKIKSCSYNDALELVHTNLYGPMKVHSYYGDQYFILFVDDYSRMMSIMFSKEKYDVLKMLKW